METLVIGFPVPFPRPSGSPLATTRHNPEIDRSVIALRLGHESAKTTQMSLQPDLRPE